MNWNFLQGKIVILSKFLSKRVLSLLKLTTNTRFQWHVLIRPQWWYGPAGSRPIQDRMWHVYSTSAHRRPPWPSSQKYIQIHIHMQTYMCVHNNLQNAHPAGLKVTGFCVVIFDTSSNPVIRGFRSSNLVCSIL